MKQYAHALPGMQAEAAGQIAALVLGDDRLEDGGILLNDRPMG